MRLLAIALLATAACGGDDRSRHAIGALVVEDCAIPADVRELVVYALGDFPASDVTAQNGPIEGALEIDKFPSATSELAVELLGPGQVVRAHGRTGRFDLDTLEPGAEIPIFVAPPRSFCRVGAIAELRRDPLVVPTGDEVLILGGTDGTRPLDTAYLYHPRTATATLLADPPYFDLSGASAIALDDGDVLLVWSGTFQIWDAASRTFGPPTVPEDPEVVLHDRPQLALLPDGRVFAGGGLGTDPRGDVAIWDRGSGQFTAATPLVRPRGDGSAIASREGGVWLFGGLTSPGLESDSAEHWTPEVSSAITVPGADAAPLPTGGFMTMSGANDLTIVSSGGAATGRSGPAAVGSRLLTPLADGGVLLLQDGAAYLFRPHAVRFDELDAPGPYSDYGAALLADGSVLLVGDEVHLYRHDLEGPRTNPPTQVFTGEDSARFVIPDDPGNATFEEDPPRLLLGGDDPRAVLAAAEIGDLDARVVVATDGAVVITLADRAADALDITITPGEPVRAGACTGTVDAGELTATAPHDVVLVARDGRLSVSLDDTPLLECDVAIPHGRFAIRADAPLTLYALTVTR